MPAFFAKAFPCLVALGVVGMFVWAVLDLRPTSRTLQRLTFLAIVLLAVLVVLIALLREQ